MMRYAIVAAVVFAAPALVACGGASSLRPTPGAARSPSAVAGTPTALPTALPGEAPMPQQVSFAPGETIAADGKAGVFFLDPYTGAAEGWVVPAAAGADGTGYLNFSFTIGGVSADGTKVVYECQHYVGSHLVPCGNDPSTSQWYLLDTTTGTRTRLTAFTGPFADISPDGETLIGAVSADHLALASAANPTQARTIDPRVPMNGYQRPAHAWSPDSTRIAITTDTTTLTSYIVRVADLAATRIAGNGVWSHDGSRLAVTASVDANRGATGIAMLDRDGTLVWSKAIPAAVLGWTDDDKMLLVDTRDDRGTAASEDDTERADVIDPATGETSARVEGIVCPDGWLGDSHRFFTRSYGASGFDQVIVDVDAGSLHKFSSAQQGLLETVPFDSSMLIEFNNDFYGLDPATSTERLIAKTTVTPAWDFLHQPLFAGRKIVFAPLHLGHGGCGEGNGPTPVPDLRFVRGPFADDAPVTRGP